MPHFDFVEIGTSNFDALIESATPDTVGLSIEPVIQHLHALPSQPHCIKLNATISDHNGITRIYYLDPEDIVLLNLPQGFEGCSSIGTPHTTVVSHLQSLGHNPDHVLKIASIPVYTLHTVLDHFDVTSIHTLKTDTEGMTLSY